MPVLEPNRTYKIEVVCTVVVADETADETGVRGGYIIARFQILAVQMLAVGLVNLRDLCREKLVRW